MQYFVTLAASLIKYGINKKAELLKGADDF